MDQGHIAILNWPDAASRANDIDALCSAANPVVRHAGGVLIEDLSLADNLMLEPALLDGALPRHLLPELLELFGNAGCAIDWRLWQTTFPAQADPLMQLQVITGRALMADPDLLLVEAMQWDDSLLQPCAFSKSFTRQYPWRTLAWASCDARRADTLRQTHGLPI